MLRIKCINGLYLANTKKKTFFFGISLNLDKFLTLKNENLFSFCSLNRNFTLSLQAIMDITERFINYTQFDQEDGLFRFEKRMAD